SLKDFYNLDPTSGQIFSIDKPLSTDGEDSLTFDEWFQAWSRLLGLIKEFLEEEYDLWKIHYKRILYKENRAEQWTLFLAYNIEIRLRATQKEIDPSIFHIAIWNDLELHLTSGRLAAAVEQKLIEKFSSGSSGSSTRNTTSCSNSNFQPYNRNDGSKSSGSSFRNKTSSHPSSRCFNCGDRSGNHTSRECTSKTLINRSECHIQHKNPGDSAQYDKAGNRYCYRWNGHSGCVKGDSCSSGVHWCTLCGGKTHGAQFCNTV
ncbi:hypothetical protein DXG01_014030, partial [Tephrocybe rancida]